MPAGRIPRRATAIAPARFTLTIDGVEIAAFSDARRRSLSEANPDDARRNAAEEAAGEAQPAHRHPAAGH